jgi:hypothetical protein
MRANFNFAILCAIVPIVLADPCTRLCEFDGPSVCTGGSYTKNGNTCHRYVYRGDPLFRDYCYHTAATKEVCPSGGASVRPDEVDLIIINNLPETTAIPEGVPADVRTTTTSEIREEFYEVRTTTGRPELPLEIDANNLIRRMHFVTKNNEPPHLRIWFEGIIRSFDRRELSRFVDLAYAPYHRRLMVSILRIPKLSIIFEGDRRGGLRVGIIDDIHMPCYPSEEEMRRDLLEEMSSGFPWV